MKKKMMKKIGIVSELNTDNVNYGNRLQSYALNYYINKNFDNSQAESLMFDQYDKSKITNNWVIEIPKGILKKIKKYIKKSKKNEWYQKRLVLCNSFTMENVKLNPKIKLSWKDLKNTNYDYFITGSDVVWAQRHNRVNRIRFLDFNAKKEFKRISYAASFGRDWIPEENKEFIKKALSKYSAISTREKSSVKMLNDIGVYNVEHICDPTLLLNKSEWSELEKKDNELSNIVDGDKFIFVYLLGKSRAQRDEIKKLALNKKLKIINICHANGIYDDVDVNFGDYQINECSPNNWLWLIHNAEIVITDSFHGAVLSTIFEKKYFILKREYEININNRMIDFMNTISQSDKIIEKEKILDFDKYAWDYDKIEKNLQNFITKSKKYLEISIK